MVITDVLYVFVTIGINLEHFVNTIKHNLEEHKESNFYLLGTIQFTNSLFMCKKMLQDEGFTKVSMIIKRINKIIVNLLLYKFIKHSK